MRISLTVCRKYADFVNRFLKNLISSPVYRKSAKFIKDLLPPGKKKVNANLVKRPPEKAVVL